MQWLQHELWSSRLTMQISNMELFWYVSYSRVSGEEVHAPVIHEFVLHVSCKDGEYIGIKNMSAWSHVVRMLILANSVLWGVTAYDVRNTPNILGRCLCCIAVTVCQWQPQTWSIVLVIPRQRCDPSILKDFKDVNIDSKRYLTGECD